MDKTELRLECMKLAITRSADINVCIAWGERIYDFVMSGAPVAEAPKGSKTLSGKKSENAEIPP